MYSLIGRMRLNVGDKVLLAAEKVADSIVDSYSRPPRTFEDVYKLAHEGQVDPLKEFTEACREERKIIPTVSSLMIPLVYCHINSFQRVSSVEKPLPGGEKKRDGWAAHLMAW